MDKRGRMLGRIVTAGVLLLAALLLLGGCGGQPGPLEQPPKVDEAQLRKEAEERRKAEEEAARLAEERRKVEEQRQQEELIATVGVVGEPPPVGPLPEPVVEGIPFDEAVPPLPAEPMLRVAVLAHGAPAGTGRQVAALIGTHERERLEERLGMAVSIVYVAETTRPLPRDSEIHYRKDYLRAAQSVAAVLSAAQWIAPMTDDELTQPRVDLLVHLGKDYR
jgi:predicted small lipoprotein YifL